MLKEIASIFFTAAFAFLLIGIVVVLLISGPKDNGQEIVAPDCDHDYVTTSRYDFIRQSYKTYSKCTKCGHEV